MGVVGGKYGYHWIFRQCRKKVKAFVRGIDIDGIVDEFANRFFGYVQRRTF